MTAIDWETRIRDAIDAFNRGDYEAVVAHASEDVELRRIETSPDSRDAIRGRDQVADFFRPDVFEDQRAELIEVIRAADDAMVTRIRFSARGAGSGLDVPPLESFVVWHIGGETVTKIEFFVVLADAIRAAGAGRA